MKVTFLV